MSGQYLLEMKGICKSFPGVKALQDVNLQLKAGEVHALLGENGAGKSTLIKVLGGIYHAEKGEIIIGGQKTDIDGVVAARHAGISIVHQELVLVPYMTVAENIFLGREPGTKMNIDRKKMVEDAQKLLDTYEMHINANMLVEHLTIAQQQMVEMAGALSQNARILILDEATASLTDQEVQALFRTIRELTAKRESDPNALRVSREEPVFQKIGLKAKVDLFVGFVNGVTIYEAKSGRTKALDLYQLRMYVDGCALDNKPVDEAVLIAKSHPAEVRELREILNGLAAPDGRPYNFRLATWDEEGIVIQQSA